MADAKDYIDTLSPEERRSAEAWLSAIGHFPNTKPLAKLLRTTPAPQAAQGLIAEYLDGDPDVVGGQLVYESSEMFQQMVGSEPKPIGWLELVKAYPYEAERLKQAGQKGAADEAARIVGAKIGLQEAQSFYKKRRAWLKHVHRVREWFRGAS
jgi:hypothetical protein